MKTLPILSIAALCLLPIAYVQAQYCPPDQVGKADISVCAGDVATDVETEGETETSELGFGAVGADEDVDLEGVTTDAEDPVIGRGVLGGM